MVRFCFGLAPRNAVDRACIFRFARLTPPRFRLSDCFLSTHRSAVVHSFVRIHFPAHVLRFRLRAVALLRPAGRGSPSGCRFVHGRRDERCHHPNIAGHDSHPVIPARRTHGHSTDPDVLDLFVVCDIVHGAFRVAFCVALFVKREREKGANHDTRESRRWMDSVVLFFFSLNYFGLFGTLCLTRFAFLFLLCSFLCAPIARTAAIHQESNHEK